MKLYATKDILLNVFQLPFAAPNDGDVLSAIAAAVNNQENMSAIAQAPHHFQIWRLGEVDEEGHISPNKELLAECSSLIRTNLRPGPNNRGTTMGGPQEQSQRTPGSASAETGTYPALTENKAPGNA